jgi:uncharacterized protein YdeI (BOF family)
MNKITISYSRDDNYPWRILDVTNEVSFHAKNLKMDGIFIGASMRDRAEIHAYGYYERSETINVINSDKAFGSDTIQEIDAIAVFGKTEENL